MQPFRFLLYCLSAFAGVASFLLGSGPFWDYAYHKLTGTSFSYGVDQLYQSAVISLLSLILLILVHLGHRLAGAFDVSMPKKPVVDDALKKTKE